jgi:hypothetical protein
MMMIKAAPTGSGFPPIQYPPISSHIYPNDRHVANIRSKGKKQTRSNHNFFSLSTTCISNLPWKTHRPGTNTDVVPPRPPPPSPRSATTTTSPNKNIAHYSFLSDLPHFHTHKSIILIIPLKLKPLFDPLRNFLF